MESSELRALRDAIRRLHGCESTYIESVAIKEAFQGKTVWEGEVHVFALLDHPKAQRAYAWNRSTSGGEARSYVLLQTRVVNTPRAAVRASIIADANK